MEFDSPDVEKDFPGLYSSEAAKKSNDSDFSDDSHEKSFKAELIGKRKDKKDSKKDRGYAALEGESSPDEGDSKSPSKSKKTKSFKFPVKKSEKREKSKEKEKEAKEKEIEKDKKKDREKKEKVKQKDKDKKKSKPDEARDADELGVFGVSLAAAAERLGCLDGVGIPLPVRLCIDCITATGLAYEGLYKTDKGAGLKSRVAVMRKKFNSREPVSAAELDVPLAAAVLISFLRELPEPLLTTELVSRFEEAGAVQDVSQREERLRSLVDQLPPCNFTLLAWLIVHFDQVTQHEKLNKINAQFIAMTYSPVLQMSHRLLTAFLCHCRALFPHTLIFRYIGPLPPGSSFPDNQAELASELRKQEALLNQIHRDMNDGFVSEKREELLWEVQRVVTQLKRKLRSLHKSQEVVHKSVEEDPVVDEIDRKKEIAPAQVVERVESVAVKQETVVTAATVDDQEVVVSAEIVDDTTSPPPAAVAEPSPPTVLQEPEEAPQQTTEALSWEETRLQQTTEGLSWEETRLQLEHEELTKLQSSLQHRLDRERRLAARFRILIQKYKELEGSDSDDSSANSTPAYVSPETEAKIEQLLEENHRLVQKRDELARAIMDEREAAMKLSVCVQYYQKKFQAKAPA